LILRILKLWEEKYENNKGIFSKNDIPLFNLFNKLVLAEAI
jgi:hypothetical protein